MSENVNLDHPPLVEPAPAIEPAPLAPQPKAPRKVKAKAKKVKAKAASGKAKAKVKARSRAVDPNKMDQFGFRLGSKKSKAAAMYATKKGATLAEVKAKLKSTQFNLLTELEGRGYKVKRDEETGGNNRKITRFFLIAK